MSTRQEEIQPYVFDSGFRAYKGFTLFVPVGATDVYLIDMEGRPVHTWSMPFELGSHGVLLPNGNLLCAARFPEGPLADFDGSSGKLVEVDWDGGIAWQYEDPYMHHDFCRMPNGNTLLLRWVPTPNDIALKVKGGLPGTEREGIMWSDSLQEINPAGEVVWEWFGYEHLEPELDIICPLCFRNEWTHANSFVVNPHGDILVSFMKTNNIAIINKESGNIYWRWGGFLMLAHPNDVSWLEDENVMILGTGRHVGGSETGDSEILCIDIETGNIVWEFREINTVNFYTTCKGNCQRLPNGNTLICEGDTGRIFEVSEAQDIVWEFINPSYRPSPIYGNNNMLFRAYRYGPDYGGLKGNAVDPDRFQQKGKPQPEKRQISKKEKAIHDRLGRLGY